MSGVSAATSWPLPFASCVVMQAWITAITSVRGDLDVRSLDVGRRGPSLDECMARLAVSKAVIPGAWSCRNGLYARVSELDRQRKVAAPDEPQPAQVGHGHGTRARKIADCPRALGAKPLDGVPHEGDRDLDTCFRQRQQVQDQPPVSLH